MIQDFIKMASQNMGVSEEQTQAATGGLLGFIQDKADPGDFQSLLGELPGAADVLKSAAGDGGGALGSLGKLAGGLLGGKMGAAAGLIGALSGSGFPTDKIDDFAGLFLGFVKQNVSGDLLGKLLDQIPDLKKLIG